MKRNTFLKYMTLAGLLPPGVNAAQNDKPVDNSHPVLKPPRLKKGDTVGLISPASIIPERGRYKEIEETIENLGFKVKIGKNARNRYGYFAGTDQDRAADLNSMFQDSEIDAIIPFRGGWGSNRLLDLIDFQAIKQNPKPLIGFSDITSLLLSIYAKTGLITFHGPVGKSEWSPFTYRHFRYALMEAKPFTVGNPADQKNSTIISGRAGGPLLGGNLTVLTSMMGSDYLPDFEGAILFLEDVGEDVYRIDRMLTQLKLNGVFDRINGLIFGKCTDCLPGNDYSLSLNEVLHDHLLSLNIPAFRGAMIGHIDDMFTLPTGLPAVMDADIGNISFPESAVR